MLDRLRDILADLCLTPGLAGHEDRVRRKIAGWLETFGMESTADRLGNLVTTFPGDPDLPSVMVFTHMDQLGFIVRKIEADGFLRLERLGGVPERALASQPVLVCGRHRDIPGVIGNKSHHATAPEEKYQVTPYRDLYVDCGFASAAEAQAAGVAIGTPIVYLPALHDLEGSRVAGTAIDDRAGCAALVLLAEAIRDRTDGPTVHVAFTVQEEFNLRGAQPLAQVLQPAMAIQIDLMLATDTPDMDARGEMRLGGGPGMSLYSFHGRGTLNGLIPHPALVGLFETTASETGMPLQRSAQTGVLTDNSYVQLVGDGVAAVDLGFPMRYSHASLEVCDLADLASLVRLLHAGLSRIDASFSLDRDRWAMPDRPFYRA